MFKQDEGKKEEKRFILDIFLDYEIKDKFNLFMSDNNLDESNALIQVLKRGMDNYWLLKYKQLKGNYFYIEKKFNEYKLDNETLIQLEQENEKMRKLLTEGQPKKSNEVSQNKETEVSI